MQNSNRFLVCLLALVLGFSGCKKDELNYTVTTGTFPSGSGLSASSSNIVLTSASANDTAVKFTWPAANFGNKIASSYKLQLDIPSDTSGPNGWSHATTFNIGNNTLSYGFVGKELNDLLTTMKLPAGTPGDVVVRIKSDVPQYNGSASSVPSVYSNAVSLKITPYALTLYIPGDYQGWDPSAAPQLNPITGRPGLYEAYVYLAAPGVHYFKFTNARDWNHTNYGDGGNGTFSTDGNAGGLSTPDSGYYELTANLNNNTWTATKTSWGIIGDATPGGWTTDTQMNYDATKQVWTVTANMLASGSYKFRANKAWAIDFGVDGNNNLQYADNPFFGYNSTLSNLSVPVNGNYTITLDLHVSGVYTYSVVKN